MSCAVFISLVVFCVVFIGVQRCSVQCSSVFSGVLCSSVQWCSVQCSSVFSEHSVQCSSQVYSTVLYIGTHVSPTPADPAHQGK